MGKISLTPDLLSGILRDTSFLISADFVMLLKRKCQRQNILHTSGGWNCDAS